jgi:hypothetical protein
MSTIPFLPSENRILPPVGWRLRREIRATSNLIVAALVLAVAVLA